MRPRILRPTATMSPGIALRDVVGPGVLARYFLPGLLVILLAILLAFVHLAVEVHINIWWFESLGLGSVYGRIWDTQKSLFLIFGFITYLLLTGVFFDTRALTFRPGFDVNARRVDSIVTLLAGFFAMLVAMLAGQAMADNWQTALLAGHAQTFGLPDPVHGKDVSFYVFTMPWREVLSNYAAAVLVLAAIEVATLAALYTVTSPFETQQGDIRRMLSVGCLFLAGLFSYLAWRNFFLNPYDLGRPGTAFGGGATFIHASLFWFRIIGAVEILAAVVLLVNVFLRRIGLAAFAAVPLAVAIFGAAGQGIFQHFVVSPNELAAEYKYLGYTVHFTRDAYGMNGWRVREYTPHALTTADVNANTSDVHDARIADAGAVTQVMRQRQENRTYYTFNLADIDRYTVNGKQRQVLLAARELAFYKLPGQAQTWVNQHLKFTHGYGLTMSPANTVTSDGQPALWIQNVPVQETISGLPPVTQPRVYFGESTNDWILTNATTSEFDSSTADRDTSYRYKGSDGIPVGSGLKRLALAWQIDGGFPPFDKLNISTYIRPTTRIHLHRNIFDRVQTIAPWLILDSDPYLVLRKDGSMVWMLDGMTHSDHFPYSEPTNGDNYRRNSVKIVVDAYTGRATFYAFDASDPILQAWSAIFPGLMHPIREMPADLVAHIKYPDSYLSWQATAYQRYHVTDITSYYNGDNEWDIEQSSSYDWENGGTSTSTLAPIWTVARLFGDKHDSFFSILPFSVRGKATMAGYLAADNNPTMGPRGGTYRLTALDMPRGAQTMGATQFESLYNQAPSISSTLTLLDQHGSQVVPGQILILPVGKALLYLKPLYLRSASSQALPQLIRITVGTGNAVNWGPTLSTALRNLLTQGDISNLGSPSSGTTATPIPTPSPVGPLPAQYAKLSDARLIALATSYYNAARRSSSLTEKDRDLKTVGEILQVLSSRHK